MSSITHLLVFLKSHYTTTYLLKKICLLFDCKTTLMLWAVASVLLYGYCMFYGAVLWLLVVFNILLCIAMWLLSVFNVLLLVARALGYSYCGYQHF